MDNIFELNTVNNVKDEVGASKVKSTSPVVEVFSALVQGKSLSSFDGKIVDKSVEHIKDLAGRAIDGDHQAVSELNAIQRFAIEPKLIEAIKIFNFMGTYKSVPYDTVPMMKTYKYESIDSRFQASSGDVPFATHSFREYPIGTQTISSGYAVDYRELQSGNFDGTIAEGISQVQTDMQNKAVYYVIAKLYDALKNAKGVKHFAENSGVTQTAVDEMLKQMRRYADTTDDVLVLNAESVRELLALRKKDEFNARLAALVTNDAEKKMIAQIAKENGGDDVAAWKMDAINKLAESVTL